MLKIDYIPIEKIKPYEKNAKLHPKEQIEQIKKSIQQFGFNDPIALWHGEIVEGHGRYIAGKELGMKELPVIYLDDLTDEQRRAYMLVHNRLTMNSGFDIDLLNEELADIFDFNMADFGFEEAITGDAFGTEFELPNGDKSEFGQITFHLHNNQKNFILGVCDAVKDQISETFGNPNEKGNAIYEVCKQWAEQKKLK